MQHILMKNLSLVKLAKPFPLIFKDHKSRGRQDKKIIREIAFQKLMMMPHVQKMNNGVTKCFSTRKLHYSLSAKLA